MLPPRQLARNGGPNAWLQGETLLKHCALRPPEQKLLDRVVDRFGLSARAYHRLLKLARTIADLGQSERIESAHLAEAISYRKFDRADTQAAA